MAKDNWSDSQRKAQDEKANRLLNLTLRAQEKEAQKEASWSVGIPQDARKAPNENYENQVAPTEATTRSPRARCIAYNSDSKTLIIVFWDNTWWQYNNVDTGTWLGLKSTSSTGGYLHKSGLNTWGDMGSASIDDIPAPVRAQIAQKSMMAGRLKA